MDTGRLASEFNGRYGSKPRIFRAPGRINLIGEHTDYNGGFVLPCAIDFATYVAAAKRDDRNIRVASLNFGRPFEFSLDELDQAVDTTWARYVQGVALLLERSGRRLVGTDILIDSTVPVGAGLSSSAALEISTAFALASIAGHKIEGMQLAKLGQAAEHEYGGVKSGIMDQFTSVFGQAEHALFLDCRSLAWESIPVSGARFVICNTKTKHDLADGEYNKRRAECEEAARFFGCEFLRDVSLSDFERRSREMPENIRKRARHVLTENERVLKSVEALRKNDLAVLGELINESHNSLRDDFEVSSVELDIMVEIARVERGVLGSRMMGGGFGGCTVNLLSPDAAPNFHKTVSEKYLEMTGINCEIYDCRIDRGVDEIS